MPRLTKIEKCEPHTTCEAIVTCDRRGTRRRCKSYAIGIRERYRYVCWEHKHAKYVLFA